MSFNPSDMELTPVQVSWKPHGATAFTDLGGTLGNVKFAVAIEKAAILADQTGSTPLDRRISGYKYMVSTKVTQTRDFLTASYVFPSASVVGGTPYDGAAPSAALVFNNQIGHSDLAVAGQLKLHPLDVATGNDSYDYLFYVACPTEASEIDHGPAEQSTWKIDWAIYPDTSTTPYRFFRYGSTAF
jgi:hypothetical protein